MRSSKSIRLLTVFLTAVPLAGVGAAVLRAQEAGAPAAAPVLAPPAVVRITLEEAKQRALANNKLLNIGTLNAEGKAFAVRAAKADYFPKVVGSAMYFHFNDQLGTVLATQGRTVSGPLGRPLLMFPPTAIDVPVLNQDSSFVNVGVLQPITDLLKVRQGVAIARADEGIAQAELEAGVRKLVSGVEQLYWGILAARRIQAVAQESVRGGETVAKTGLLEARIALNEARQGLQQVNQQIADLQEQLNGLLDFPPCTTLELVEPPFPVLPYKCADDVVALAEASSPEIREAQHTIAKAQAALAAGKLDFVPSVAAVGGYVNQTAASYVQQDIGYIGAVATYTFVDWGKRRNIIWERRNLVAMATLKLRQTEDDIRQKARKAFRDVAEGHEALKTAEEMVALRKEAVKQATTPEAMRNPAPLLTASKDLAAAEVDLVKADLTYRTAYVQLMGLIGQK